MAGEGTRRYTPKLWLTPCQSSVSGGYLWSPGPPNHAIPCTYAARASRVSGRVRARVVVQALPRGAAAPRGSSCFSGGCSYCFILCGVGEMQAISDGVLGLVLWLVASCGDTGGPQSLGEPTPHIILLLQDSLVGGKGRGKCTRERQVRGGHLLRELFFVAGTGGGVQPQVEPWPGRPGAGLGSGAQHAGGPRRPAPQTCRLAPAW